LGVKLNGLTAYEWQLDDGDVSDVTTDPTFTVTGLAVGSHTVSLWGIDANGVRQSDATTIALFYKTPDIVGDVLTGVITPDKDEVGDSDIVAYTLTMSEAIVNDPVAANFTVANGTIVSIADVDGNKTTYTITVKPKGDGFVSISLKANTLFTADKGIPNTASEAGKALYYTKPLITFTPVVVDGLNEDGVAYVGKKIKVDIDFESAYAFRGGDLGIMFDSTVFELADVTSGKPDATKMLNKEYQLIHPENGKKGYIASWIKEGSKIIGIRLGGAKISDEATGNNNYATVTFTVKKEVKEGSVIKLQALDNTDEYAGIALPGMLLQGDQLAAVSYGEVAVVTALERPVLSLAAAQATVEEGQYNLTINLSYALNADLAVDFIENGTVLSTQTIKKGKTSVTVKMNKADNLLTGDRVFTYAIACASDAVIVNETPAMVTVTDNDTAITLTSEAAEINEGGQMVITFKLANGITAAYDVTFDSPLVPTTDPATFTSGIDFRMNAEPVIKAGENSGTITIKTYSDNAMNGKYKITVALTGMTVGANVCSKFAAKSVTFTVKDSNFKPGDFTNNNIVDYHDVLEFLAAMGASSADANWAENAMYDLNGDDVVDYHDLIELLSLMEINNTRTRGESQNVLNMWLEADKMVVNPGDVVTIRLMVENMSGKAFCGFGCNVNFNAADLAYNGSFSIDDIMDKTVFSIQAGGALAENGIANLNGGCLPGSTAQNAEPCELAVMSFIVQNTAAGNISIDLSNIDATVSGAIVRKGQLDVARQSLTLTVVNGTAVVPEFDIEFAAHQTRAGNVALKVGMANGATYAYEADDLLAFDPSANVYDVRVIDGRRDEDLLYDIRGLANRETWNVMVTVKGDNPVTLDWSNAELPEYFDFTIVKGKSHFDEEAVSMRATTSMTFEKGESFFTIVADKVASAAAEEFIFNLNPGWNFIGIPFELDAASLAKFNGIVYGYSADADAYVQYDAAVMVAGASYWVYVTEAKTITVSAAVAAPTAGVQLSAGWNFVAPKKGDLLCMPGAPVRAVWFYTQDGYRQATKDADIKLGRGYWIYSDEATFIWTK
jgi:aspartate 1-decarboxylase